MTEDRPQRRLRTIVAYIQLIKLLKNVNELAWTLLMYNMQWRTQGAYQAMAPIRFDNRLCSPSLAEEINQLQRTKLE